MPSGRPERHYKRMNIPYTRKEYINRVPNVPDALKHKVYGNKKADFPAKISLVAIDEGQVGANCLDSIRATAHRNLEILGDKYRLEIKPYPHHIIRWHGLIGVAKGERIAHGMKLSFGAPFARMAQIKRGATLLEIRIPDNAVAFGISRNTLETVSKKIGIRTIMKIEGVSPENRRTDIALPKRTKGESKGGRVQTPAQVPEPKVGA